MTDKEKLEAIRTEIHRLVDVRGYDREMANNLFTFMDSLPNEPVSEELEKASKEWLRPQLDKSYANYGEVKMMEFTHFDGYAMLDAVEFGAQWQKEKDEFTTEDLGEYINELSKQFPEVSFAKLSRIAVRVSKWQKEQFEKNRLAACDRQTEEEAEIESDFVMGIIKNEHRQPTFDDAIKYGAKWQKEKMIANTADAMIGLPYENKDGGYTHIIDVSRPLPVGNNKIAIIFKED